MVAAASAVAVDVAVVVDDVVVVDEGAGCCSITTGPS